MKYIKLFEAFNNDSITDYHIKIKKTFGSFFVC